MCTVTILDTGDNGFRMVASRDESPTRARASSPRWVKGIAGDARAIWPIDGRAGGTWVAAGEHGLVLTVLNVNLKDPPMPDEDRRVSRGSIIPQLIRLRDADAAAEALAGFELDRFEPFRLVAADSIDGELRIVQCRWDGVELVTTQIGSGPACFASSGLGDEHVEPRLPLFDEMIEEDGPTPDTQDAYHMHRWPDRPEISVLMERPGAMTISITTIQMQPLDEDGTDEPGSRRAYEVEMDYVHVDSTDAVLEAAGRCG